MLGLTILQNASFTLVSRARNSNSIKYNAIASVFSNGIWVLVFRQLAMNLDDITMIPTYILGTVSGSILMQWISINYLEKKKKP
jgi:hypothetical protein